MNTPAHLIVGWAVFGRRDRPRVTLAAVLGGLAPDLSLYVLVAWAGLVQGRTPRQIFDQDYFSATWQTVFAIDNSVFVWGFVLAAGLVLSRGFLVAFAGAALLHLALDFPLHAGDGRPHFWPLTDWVFDSPVSYWDVRHHASIVAPLEAGLSLLLAGIIATRHWPTIWPLLLLAALLAAQLSVGGFWAFVFA